MDVYFRLVKEKFAYEKELEREKQRLEKMKEENRDVYEINKQVCIWLHFCAQQRSFFVNHINNLINLM